MMKQEDDPVIDEIREVRHRISARFDHDPTRLVAYYIELQEQYRGRFVDSPTKERRQPALRSPPLSP